MKKIMFNDVFRLTKEVLERRKWKTRRIAKCNPEALKQFQEEYYNATMDLLDGKDLVEAYFVNNPNKVPYKVGEIVAIAQSYETISQNISKGESSEKAEFYCKVMNAHFPNSAVIRDKEEIPGWRNKMFVRAELMPNRIQITDMHIEYLQDISNEDCLAEGIIERWHAPACRNYYYVPGIEVKSVNDVYESLREAYAVLIDKISGKGTWDRNPIVFAYDFKLVK